MKKKLDQLLNLGAAAITLAAACGMHLTASAVCMAVISVGMAISAGLKR